MTRFYLNAGALGRWIYQNKAQYTGAYVEFTDYKNGFKNGEVDKIWSDWYDFEEKASA